MDPIVVVGSGATGVHFALSALEKGRRVLMIDVGHARAEPVLPNEPFNTLKERLDDPVRYFLGEDFEALTLPGNQSEFYRFPPSKQYVFRAPPDAAYRATGFAPLSSFAAGGLAEAWTGGCYPYNDAELAEFPFGYDVLAPYYTKVAERIGVAGADDDMARFFPLHGGLHEPLQLDEHSRLIMESYQRQKRAFNDKLGCYFGRARIATLSRDRGIRKGCTYLGRCLWGCPTNAFYTPSQTLAECRAHANFRYVAQTSVSHFVFDASGRVRKLVARSLESGTEVEFDVGTLVLAAGTLSSAKIFMDSIYHDSGEVIRLSGLMDNRQILMPFVNFKLIGRPFDPESYQYHQLAIGIETDDPRDYVHGLITTLKTALIHPVVQSIPFSLGMALGMLRNAHAALGLANINFRDHRRNENSLTLEVDRKSGQTRLVIEYHPEPGEQDRIKRMMRKFRGLLHRLGCIAPAALVHQRPMGASVHYAGTIPMTDKTSGPSTDASCRSRDFENLYFVDGTTFPDLPAKNLTFTMMANATRVADAAFD
jgi:choline dehydrogenase-like flavoprotein